MKFNLNNQFTSLYRMLAVVFLSIIFIIAVGYAGLIGVYAVNSSWAGPIVLSPTQERVLTFQPQVAGLEAGLDKQKVELETALATKKLLDEQVIQLTKLMERVDQSITAEAIQLKKLGSSAEALARVKRGDVGRAAKTVAEAKRLLAQVDQELAAKLITSDQAAQRKIALTAAMGAVTDGNITAMQLESQATQAQSAAETFTGSGPSSSMSAVSSIRQSIELRSMIAQLQIQAITAQSSADALKRSIDNSQRVLDVAKASPYYRALREEITVAFVPYDNLESVEVGDKVYDCYLQVIACRKVGRVKTIYDAEERIKHPLFKTDLRGKLVEIKFTDPDSSKSQVVFIGGKPLLL